MTIQLDYVTLGNIQKKKWGRGDIQHKTRDVIKTLKEYNRIGFELKSSIAHQLGIVFIVNPIIRERARF